MSIPFPVPDATPSFWRTELHPLDTHRTTEELPSECDVLIVGSGYAGVATAYHLLDGQATASQSIVILEAREACSGATARNGGQLKADTYENLFTNTQKYGVEAATEFARFEYSQVFAVKALVEKENIQCDLNLTRTIDVYLDEDHAKAIEASYRELVKIGLSLPDIQFTPERDAERISGVKGAKCCFSVTAGHLWPYKMVMHLLSLVIKKGVNLQTNTSVTSISESPNPENGKWTVTTPRGGIHAAKVVFATNGYTAGIAPQFTNKIIPVRGICSRIVTPEDRPSPILTNTYSIRHGSGLYDYLIPRPDGSIIVGGAKPDFWEDKSLWYGVYDDSKLIEPAKNYFDGLMQRTFRGWEDSHAYTDKVWTGIMGYTSDYMPYVGDVPDKPGQFIVAGFTGHGMPLILLSAKGIAEMIRGEKSFEQTDLPRLFKPSKERLESEKNEILCVKPLESGNRIYKL